MFVVRINLAIFIAFNHNFSFMLLELSFFSWLLFYFFLFFFSFSFSFYNTATLFVCGLNSYGVYVCGDKAHLVLMCVLLQVHFIFRDALFILEFLCNTNIFGFELPKTIMKSSVQEKKKKQKTQQQFLKLFSSLIWLNYYWQPI